MKILHINTYDSLGGAAIAAYRLHKSMIENDVESYLYVQRQNRRESNIIGPESKLGKLSGYYKPHLDKLLLCMYPHRSGVYFSPAMLGSNSLKKVVERIKPDIVNIHWITDGFIKPKQLEMFNCPVVWTLHDSWAFTGGCHIHGGCNAFIDRCSSCPQLNSKVKKDLSYHGFRRKELAYSNINLSIVAASHWLLEEAKKSHLLKHCSFHRISHPLDLSIYKSNDKEKCREILGLSKEDRVLCTGAVMLNQDKNKGFDLLIEALKYVNDLSSITLIVFGVNEIKESISLLFKDVKIMGFLYDDISKVLVYNASDVVVVPSRSESYGLVAAESIACGTPVAAFDTTGIKSVVDHQKTGYLAEPFDPEDFANGINLILNNGEWSNIDNQEFRNKIASNKIVSQYLDMYSSIIGKVKS